MGVSAVLLAAGRSERMGEQKALMDWGGRTLLTYQLEQLANVQRIDEIIVVTGYAAERLRPSIEPASRAREALNAAFDEGKAGSVRTGMCAVSGRATSIILLAVDQPRPATVIDTLLDAHDASRARISVPVLDGHRGHPIVFDARLLPELRAVDDATLGVRAVLNRHAQRVQEVPFEDPIVCLDLNTPDDVARGLAMMLDGP